MEYSNLFSLNNNPLTLKVNADDFVKKNNLICNQVDYMKLAEIGVIQMLTEAGVKCIQTEYAEAGKPIVTGALAIALFKEINEG